MMQHPKRRMQGFTLLELAVVIAIIAALAVGSIAALTASLAQRQELETRDKQAQIQEALLNFRRAFDRLPCPADITIAMDNANYGVEGQNTGNCRDGAPVASFEDGGEIVGGAVPTKTLRLPDDVAIDGWGRRMLYAVDRRGTANTDPKPFKDINMFGSMEVTATTTADITINVTMTGPVLRTNSAVYALLSFGPNGHGGFSRGNGATNLAFDSRMNANSVNVDELENCDCTATATATVAGFNNVFVQRLPERNPAAPLDSFDDIVVYATRAQLPGFTE